MPEIRLIKRFLDGYHPAVWYRRDAIFDAATGFAAEDSKTIGRYVACENHAGGGFFWVDTTTGKAWLSDMTTKEKIEWKYYGQP